MATHSPARMSGLHKNHATFLQRFTAREAQYRVAKQKPTLSVKQHAAHRAQLSNVRFVKPKYSDQTEINVSGIFIKWKRYAKLPYGTSPPLPLANPLYL